MIDCLEINNDFDFEKGEKLTMHEFCEPIAKVLIDTADSKNSFDSEIIKEFNNAMMGELEYELFTHNVEEGYIKSLLKDIAVDSLSSISNEAKGLGINGDVPLRWLINGIIILFRLKWVTLSDKEQTRIIKQILELERCYY